MKTAPGYLFLLWLLCSCIKEGPAAPNIYSPVPDPPPSSVATKSYLALGDSYTVGQSVTAAERFPAQTAALLKQAGVPVADPVYIAQTGWTTANLQTAIAFQNPPATFDVVSLLIGVNDQYQGLDTAGYATRFTALLESAIRFAKSRKERVFVVSIPDYSVTPFVPASEKARIKAEIDLFNSINRRITIAYQVDYTDITPSSRQAATNPALLASDNLHPSGTEYKKWADLLLPKIKNVLQ